VSKDDDLGGEGISAAEHRERHDDRERGRPQRKVVEAIKDLGDRLVVPTEHQKKSLNWTRIGSIASIAAVLIAIAGFFINRAVQSPRAFVSVSLDQRLDREDGRTSGPITAGTWRLFPKWTNTGSTSTRALLTKVSVFTTCGYLPDDWEFPDIIGPGNGTPAPAPLDLAPTKHFDGPEGFVDSTVIDAVNANGAARAPELHLYVTGWAVYGDEDAPTSVRHVTRFSYLIDISGDETNENKLRMVLRPTPHYNCTDSECEDQGYPANWRPKIARRATVILSYGGDNTHTCDGRHGFFPPLELVNPTAPEDRIGGH